MKFYPKILSVILLTTLLSPRSFSQKDDTSVNKITASELESYVSFLASPLLKGRQNGAPGLEIAGEYIASQAKLIGLKPANGSSYFQPYTIYEKFIDNNKTSIQVISDEKDTVKLTEPIYQLVPTGPSDFTLEGEVVFAGYGIVAEKYSYDDLSGIDANGKILLVMNRAPVADDGSFRFEGTNWSSFSSIQAKLSTLVYSGAKAIFMVMDPKSGFNSFDEQYPAIASQISSRYSFNNGKTGPAQFSAIPKIIFIHRNVADELLKGTGHSLSELQTEIDKDLKPKSFELKGKKLQIDEVSLTREKIMNNVAGYIEGSDPKLKNEFIVFSGHYDHIGEQGGVINTGADDDASGCAALLSIADAVSKMDKKPLRSILFLWVSGEEIGLYGSKSYVNNPLVPLKNTVADLNIDMIGRVKSPADSTDEHPMSGPQTVFVISGNQSKELMNIAEKIDSKSPLDFDYSLSGRDHPLQLFQRSDHFNFVKNDIPVLFFSTGLHTDYHTPGDVIEKLDFKKMELITRTIYQIGMIIANNKERLVVDNPYSTWPNTR